MRITIEEPSGPPRVLACAPGETVLAALSRQGVTLPSACQAGVCQACLVRALSGDPGPAGSAGLDPALAAGGYFLACQARPESDLTLALAGADVYTPARLLSVRPIGAGVSRVRVRPDRPVEFRAGQYAAVRVAGPGRGPDLVRAYSFATTPGEAERHGVEFHVRRYPGGAMSSWLATARPGAELSVGRPSGTCCYRPEDPGAPLLLAGTGTGLAPLAAIARDALARGHHGPIVLLAGAGGTAGQYPEAYLPTAPVLVRWCIRSRGDDLVPAAVAAYAGLAARGCARSYLCGGPGVVSRLRRALFLAGQSLRVIHADAFTPAAVSA